MPKYRVVQEEKYVFECEVEAESEGEAKAVALSKTGGLERSGYKFCESAFVSVSVSNLPDPKYFLLRGIGSKHYYAVVEADSQQEAFFKTYAKGFVWVEDDTVDEASDGHVQVTGPASAVEEISRDYAKKLMSEIQEDDEEDGDEDEDEEYDDEEWEEDDEEEGEEDDDEDLEYDQEKAAAWNYEAAVEEIRSILWPDEDPGCEWDADLLMEIVHALEKRGLAAKAKEGDEDE